MIDNISCKLCNVKQYSHMDMLQQDDIIDVSNNKSCNFYKKGQVIFYEGKIPNGVFCLNSGKAKIFKNGFHGKEHIVRFVTPGQFIGIRSFLGQTEYKASASTLEDSIICYISRPYFERLMMKYPKFVVEMMHILSSMLEDAEEKITSLAQKPVRERLAEALLTLNRIYVPNTMTQNEYTITLTREDLANIVGTATETVIRLLSDFKNEKLISIQRRKISLLDVRGLKTIGRVFE